MHMNFPGYKSGYRALSPMLLLLENLHVNEINGSQGYSYMSFSQFILQEMSGKKFGSI